MLPRDWRSGLFGSIGFMFVEVEETAESTDGVEGVDGVEEVGVEGGGMEGEVEEVEERTEGVEGVALAGSVVDLGGVVVPFSLLFLVLSILSK